MAHAGKIVMRAYICQSIVAIIECMERNDWDELIIEPDSAHGQVDIGLYSNEKMISAIQVKTSSNAFSRAQIQRWLEILKKDVDGVSDIYLYLVGDSFTPSSEAFIHDHIKMIKKVSLKSINAYYVQKLAYYIEESGTVSDVTIDDIELVGANFLSQLILSNTYGRLISRAEFEAVLWKTLLLRQKNNNRDSTLDTAQNPRVFISYSWTNEEYVKKVYDLAVKLMGDGVDVILDRWSLRQGQDMNVFMEHSIRDADKVLILCDEKYTFKANDRKGGVGKETTIISEEVFEAYDQRKFIPVFMEPSRLLPTYLKTRFAVDLNDGNQDGYTDLIGAIFDVNKKPLLGPINYELLAKARK